MIFTTAGHLRALRVIVVLFLIFCCVDSVLGRKCVCTSKACKEKGAKTCRTRFSCYTELIYSGEGTAALASATGAAIKTTRGCTDNLTIIHGKTLEQRCFIVSMSIDRGATPLLCETKSWRASEEQENSNSNSLEQLGRVVWPRLTCCDDRDYCNAADEDFETTSIHSEDQQEITPEFSSNRVYDFNSRSSVVNDNVKAHQNVQTLHVAALVLAIAALISVFAACYVVTRFLNASGANNGLPIRIPSPYGNGMDV